MPKARYFVAIMLLSAVAFAPILIGMRTTTITYGRVITYQLLLHAVAFVWSVVALRGAGLFRLRSSVGKRPPLILLAAVVLTLYVYGSATYHMTYAAAEVTGNQWVTSWLQPDPVDILPGMIGERTYVAYEIILIIVVAPIIEEVVFRGYLLRHWVEKWGVAAGIAITSVAFAMLHGNVLGALGLGVVLGVLALNLGGLGIPIAMHTALNAFHVLGGQVWWDHVLDFPSGPVFVVGAAATAAAALLLWYQCRRIVAGTPTVAVT